MITEARRLAFSGRQKKRRLPSRPSAGRAAQATWARLLLAVFALFLHGARISEAWIVQHALCEHGEVVHAGAYEAEESAGHAEEFSHHAGESAGHAEKTSRHAEEISRHAEEPEHDHCVASTLHHRTGDIGPSIAEPSLIAIALSRGVASRPEARPIELLSLAPKSSPPRAPRLL